MTFIDKFDYLNKEYAKKVDVTKIKDKFLAVQVTLTDADCGGTFYSTFINGAFAFEPYDYHDNTVYVRISSKLLENILSGKTDAAEEYNAGHIEAHGNLGHALQVINALKKDKTVKEEKKAPKAKKAAKDKKEAPVKAEKKAEVKAAAPVKEEKKTEVKTAAPVKEEKKAEVKAAAPVKEEKKAEVKAAAPVKEEKKAEVKAAAPVKKEEIKAADKAVKAPETVKTVKEDVKVNAGHNKKNCKKNRAPKK